MTFADQVRIKIGQNTLRLMKWRELKQAHADNKILLRLENADSYRKQVIFTHGGSWRKHVVFEIER